MTIRLHHDAFDAIMQTSKNFINKKLAGTRPELTMIKLCCNGNTVTAIATNEFAFGTVTVSCVNGDEGTMFIPYIKPIGKKGVYADISATENSVTVQTAETCTTYPVSVNRFPDLLKSIPTDPAIATTFF